MSDINLNKRALRRGGRVRKFHGGGNPWDPNTMHPAHHNIGGGGWSNDIPGGGEFNFPEIDTTPPTPMGPQSLPNRPRRLRRGRSRRQGVYNSRSARMKRGGRLRRRR